MKTVDLNSDLGESFGAYKIGMDFQVLQAVSSANIACGFHAGDPSVMAMTVELAAKNHIAVGAHPGFPDLQGFGRRNMTVDPVDLKAMVQYQVGALNAFCMANGIRMQHVKPHGAMYNMAAKDKKMARAICEGIYAVDPEIYLLGLSGSVMLDAAREVGLVAKSEVFADRAYEEDGSLVARTKEGAMIRDPELAKKRVLQMVTEGTVTSITGKVIPIQADSICVHGDNEKALIFTREIRALLEENGVKIAPLRG